MLPQSLLLHAPDLRHQYDVQKFNVSYIIMHRIQKVRVKKFHGVKFSQYGPSTKI